MRQHTGTLRGLVSIAGLLLAVGALCEAQVPGILYPYADVYVSGSSVQGYVSSEYYCAECYYLYDVSFRTEVTATLTRAGTQVDWNHAYRDKGTAYVLLSHNPATPNSYYELQGEHLVSVQWRATPEDYMQYGYKYAFSRETVTTPALPPRITSLSPDGAYPGDFGTLTIWGANFDSSACIWVDGGGISMYVMSVSYDGSSMTVEYSVSSGAIPGQYTVTVQTAGGWSNPAYFWVYQQLPPPPHIGGLSPDQNIQCGSGYFGIYGQNFGMVPLVTIGGPGITHSTTYISDIQINVRYTVSCTASTGGHPVTVVTPYGTSNSVMFTVNPASVEITATNIEQDYVEVRLSGPPSGTLRVELSGDGVGWLITDGTSRPPGTYRIAIGRDSLPPARYWTYTATWVIPPGYITDETRIYAFALASFEIRDVNHTRYNTVREVACTGGPAPAYTTVAPPACTFSATTMKSDFIQKVESNGSGRSIQHGDVQREWDCMSSPNKPADAGGRSFRPGTIRPYCGTWLGEDTIAVHSTSGLDCGQRIVILAPGGGIEAAKTVTDRCGGGCASDAETHFDNYSTAQCCGWDCSPDIGIRRTIIMR